jgi:hypothetical protein
MIAEYTRYLPFPDQGQDLSRLRAVSDAVPQADDVRNLEGVDILQNGLKGCKISVNVRNDGLSHGGSIMGRQRILFPGSGCFQVSDPVQKVFHLTFEDVDLTLLLCKGQVQFLELLFLKGLRRLHMLQPGRPGTVFPAFGVV